MERLSNFRGVILSASLILASAAAHAQDTVPVDQRIAAIREMVLYARYTEADNALNELGGRADLTPSERNEVLEIQAIVLIAGRQTRRAEEVLHVLYGRDPDHRLLDRDVGPSVRAAFERARDAGPPRLPVRIANVTPPRLERRESPLVSMRIEEGADVVHELRVSYRNGNSGPFEQVIMRFDETRQVGSTRLPLREGSEGYTAQYYVDALAPSQAVISSVGSAAEPMVLEVPEQVIEPGTTIINGRVVRVERQTNVVEEWWFWTLIGVVAAGAAVSLGIVFGTDLVFVPPGTLGEGPLQ